MSLQERTIVVRNFDSEKTTEALLKELCLQAGPVRKVVLRPDHAFVEFDDIDSVGYSRALLDGVVMFNRPLSFEPKLSRLPEHQKYIKGLSDYIAYDRNQRASEQQRVNMQQYMQQQQQHMQYQLRMQMLMQQQQNQQPQLQAPQQMYIAPSKIMPFNQYQTR